MKDIFVAGKRERDDHGRFKAGQTEMIGVFVSQARAHTLCERFEIYFSHMTGFYVRVDNISREDYTYHIHRTGDRRVAMPANAYRFNFS